MNTIQCLIILFQKKMKNRLLKVFKRVRSRHSFTHIYNPNLYVVDWANANGGNVEISGAQYNTINAVHIENNPNISIFFDGFKKNALPITRNTYSKQCECVLFPIHCNTKEWVLFVETKYAADLQRAQKKEANYPYCMVKQIKETVKYFRDNGIISQDKVVHAIISFPNLIQEFNSWAFPIKHEDGMEESILDIRINDKILIRATNHAQIVDDKSILLLS